MKTIITGILSALALSATLGVADANTLAGAQLFAAENAQSMRAYTQIDCMDRDGGHTGCDQRYGAPYGYGSATSKGFGR